MTWPTKEERAAAKAAKASAQAAITVRVDALESNVAKVLEGVNMLAENFKELRDNTKKLPMAQKPEKVLEAANMTAGKAAARTGNLQSRSRVANVMNPRGALRFAFDKGDVIRLSEESPLYHRIRDHSNERMDAPPLGVVLRPLQVDKRSGEQKYRVHFEGIGEDGCLEPEMELVKSAV